MSEAIVAVTPSETIKCGVLPSVWHATARLSTRPLTPTRLPPLAFLRRTKLVEDSRRAVPQYRGLIHGTKEIVKAEGLLGIYRGLSAVVRPPRHPRPLAEAFMLMMTLRHDIRSDPQAGRQFGRALYDVLEPQAARPGLRSSRPAPAWRRHLWSWCCCRCRHRLYVLPLLLPTFSLLGPPPSRLPDRA